MNITNSSNKWQNSFKIDFHNKLYFGEKYTFTIQTIACQNQCNETSDQIPIDTGNKKIKKYHIFKHRYFKALNEMDINLRQSKSD
jgi:hypothetical protein